MKSGKWKVTAKAACDEWRRPVAILAYDPAKQLRRAASSVRADYRACRKGRTRREFEAKLGIAAEEADECVGWLEYLKDAGIAHSPELLDESRQLASILTASVKTAKRNSARTKGLPNT